MFVNTKISELVGSNTRLHDHVGVEIEVEHKRRVEELNVENQANWRVEHDGSLRINGAEYVFKNPLTVAAAKASVLRLGAHIEDTNEVINAGRAGVHVHINIGDLTVRELTNYLALYHSVEPLLVNWCGKHRKGNLFCLTAEQAEYIVDKYTDALEKEDLSILHTDQIRYSAINLKAIKQYGSIEFRAMRSDGDWKQINVLIDVLMNLKTLARQVDSPIQVVADSSMLDKEEFVNSLLGKHAYKFIKYPNYEQDIMSSIRLIQQYAYCKEW